MFPDFWLSTLVLLGASAFGWSTFAAEPSLKEGVVVSAGDGKLTLTDTAGKQHTLTIPDTAEITFNGKRGKLTDLKPGVRIRVMTDGDGKVMSVSTVDDAKARHSGVTEAAGPK
ncbi:MAG: hypothetical protein SFU86_06565 [Pirellulaceae bacterium]|nr:hypothetical protein [Pirellulaceae bacterium]